MEKTKSNYSIYFDHDDERKDKSINPPRKIEDGKCFKCKLELNGSSGVVLWYPNCGHKIHGYCDLILNSKHEYIQPSWQECKICLNKMEEITDNIPSAPLLEEKEEQLVSSHSPPKYEFFKGNKEYKREDNLNSWKSPPRNMEMKLEKKNAIRLSKLVGGDETVIKDGKVDGESLIGRTFTLDRLENHRIHLSIDEVYHVCGICSWEKLLLMNFGQDYLSNKKFPIKLLVDYYHVNYWILKRDLKISINTLIAGRFSFEEFKKLQITKEVLMIEGFSESHLSQLHKYMKVDETNRLLS